MSPMPLTRPSWLVRLAKPAGLAAIAGLLLAIAPMPASAIPAVVSCYVQKGGRPSTHDTTCAFEVAYFHRGDPGPDDMFSFSLSCTVLAGYSSCNTVLDPVELGVPAGYVLQNVATAPLALTAEDEGCIYSSFLRPGQSLLGRYPIVLGSFDTPSSTLAFPYPATEPLASTPTTSSPFPFIFGTDPMPAIPSTTSSMPFRIVALHDFDCAGSL